MEITFLMALLALGQTVPSDSYTSAYETSFRSAFRARSIQECVASADAAAKAGIDVTPICTCVSDRLLATKSVAELSQKQSDAELGRLANECIRAHPPDKRH